MAALPTELYAHKYWFLFGKTYQSSQKSYKSCLYKNDAVFRKCREKLPFKVCPQWFGEDPKVTQRCAEEINGQNSSSIPEIQDYLNCRASIREKMSSCINMLEDACKKSQLRVVKSVRTSMTTVAQLLHQLPQLRVVHLVRDPRGVVLSRQGNPSFRGRASHDNLVEESLFYCRDAVRDLALRQTLQKQYPGQFMEVIYDDFTKYPRNYSEAIYSFVGEKIPPATREYIIKNTEGKFNSSAISEKWQDKLNYRQVLHIKKNCQNFYNEVHYDWP